MECQRRAAWRLLRRVASGCWGACSGWCCAAAGRMVCSAAPGACVVSCCAPACCNSAAMVAAAPTVPNGVDAWGPAISGVSAPAVPGSAPLVSVTGTGCCAANVLLHAGSARATSPGWCGARSSSVGCASAACAAALRSCPAAAQGKINMDWPLHTRRHSRRTHTVLPTHRAAARLQAPRPR